jgi:hypothetical protein
MIKLSVHNCFIHYYKSFLHRFFSPLGMAPVVGLVGLGLFQRGFPAVCIAMGGYIWYLFS